jgi:hypothetical protein
MGRGPGWSEEDIQKVKVYISDNFGPKRIKELNPDWSISTLRATLSLKCYKQVKALNLKHKQQEQRKTWCQRLLLRTANRKVNKLKPLDLNKVLWTDEKLFRTRASSASSQNQRFWSSAATKKAALTERPDAGTRPASKGVSEGVMVSLAVSAAGGAAHPHFVPAGAKVNAEAYVNMLEHYILPQLHAHAGDAGVLQQDNAPAHQAKLTTNFLNEHKVTLLPFPPNSPDLTVLDY